MSHAQQELLQAWEIKTLWRDDILKQLQKDLRHSPYTDGHIWHSHSSQINTQLLSSPPYQCCYGFSNDTQSNKQQHWKGEGVRNAFINMFPILF